MTDLATFEQYNKQADILIEHSTKERLTECARLLALNIAHYQIMYGEIPLGETLALLDAAEPNAEQLKLFVRGMEIFVGVLGNISSELEEPQH